MKNQSDTSFQDAIRGLMAGDFSRLAPLFETPSDGSPCPVVKWYEAGLFASEPQALAEAFTNDRQNNKQSDKSFSHDVSPQDVV